MNRRRELVRYEFMGAIIRLADAKFTKAGPMEDIRWACGVVLGFDQVVCHARSYVLCLHMSSVQWHALVACEFG